MADPHAFISYVREDAGVVDEIQAALEAAGVPVWRDVHSVWPGEDWEERIRDAIEDDALVFIACFSAASEARERSYQREEIVLAVEQLRRRAPDRPWFFPVRLSDCRIPGYEVRAGRTLASYHAVDLFGPNRDQSLARLVEGVRRLVTNREDPAPNVHRQIRGNWSEREWERLVHQLANGDCTPFLGPGVSSPPLPSEAELARRWAEEHGVETDEGTTLADVMQKVSNRDGDPVSVKMRFARQLAELGEPDYSHPGEPHTLLAGRPISSYITTAYDDFMTRALVRNGKQPVNAICPWYQGADDDPETELPRGLTPSVERPLVYHLHGSLRHPVSLVLAEQDDTEFQARLIPDIGGALPLPVRWALSRQPLLFLGYDLGDRRFRALLQTVLAGLISRRRHAVVQPPSRRAADFVGNYTDRLNLAVYLGTVGEFCAELSSRLG